MHTCRYFTTNGAENPRALTTPLASSYQQANANGAHYTDLGHYGTYHNTDAIDQGHIYVYGYRADASVFSENEFEFTKYGVYTVAVPR